MPTLKDVELKIKAVKKTKQITKAMNMVAASRLRGAQQNMDAFRPYASKFSEVLGSLAEKAGDEASPLLVPKEAVKKIHIVLCTSDRGLCGGFNLNLIEKAGTLMKEKAGEDVAFSFTYFGKKGRDWGRNNNYEKVEEYLGVVGTKFDFSVASKSGRRMVDGFLADDYDEVYVVYARVPGHGQAGSHGPAASADPPDRIGGRGSGRRSALSRPNIFASPALTNCWGNCFPAMFTCRSSARFWRHPPANMGPA